MKADICAIQESKINKVEETEGFNIVCFERKQWHYGLAFFVRRNLVIEESVSVNDRISYIVVRKFTRFRSKATAKGNKIFRIKKM